RSVFPYTPLFRSSGNGCGFAPGAAGLLLYAITALRAARGPKTECGAFRTAPCNRKRASEGTSERLSGLCPRPSPGHRAFRSFSPPQCSPETTQYGGGDRLSGWGSPPLRPITYIFWDDFTEP